MGTCGIARFASEVNGKCLGASKSELLEEESTQHSIYLKNSSSTNREQSSSL
jgi:hypothetical protein